MPCKNMRNAIQRAIKMQFKTTRQEHSTANHITLRKQAEAAGNYPMLSFLFRTMYGA